MNLWFINRNTKYYILYYVDRKYEELWNGDPAITKQNLKLLQKFMLWGCGLLAAMHKMGIKHCWYNIILYYCPIIYYVIYMNNFMST
jgi:hypothetical protein